MDNDLVKISLMFSIFLEAGFLNSSFSNCCVGIFDIAENQGQHLHKVRVLNSDCNDCCVVIFDTVENHSQHLHKCRVLNSGCSNRCVAIFNNCGDSWSNVVADRYL